MKPKARILLTGGGTAGHVNPALAIGASLRDEGTELLFVGVRGRAEEQVVPREGIPIRFVRASGFPGARPSPALLRFLLDLLAGTLQAIAVLLSFRPHVVVGTGGYVSAPVVLAAAILRTLRLLGPRVYLHEQNAVPGKLNETVGRLADAVFVTFPETLGKFPTNGVLAGYPLRKRIGAVSREDARAGLDFEVPAGRTVVFAFGGSQGARTINRAVVDALGDLLPHRDRLFVVHGTGLPRGSDGYDAQADTAARLAARYTVEERRLIATFYVSRPYFHAIEKVYALADLAVVRAGSGTLNELSTVGLPALVVPKANLPGDHQVMNARALQRAGGAEVLYEETVLEDGELVERLDGAHLAERVLALVADPGRLRDMAARSRTLLCRDALAVIRAHVKGEGAVEPAAPEATTAAAPFPSNTQLLSRLEKVAGAAGRTYSVEAAVPDPADLRYFRSRAASLLVSEEWEARNLGVKLLGLLHAADKLPLLLALLSDRTPAPLLARLLGGDFRQVGFIRRNGITAIGRIGVVTPEVEEVLLEGLSDPYYEVRVEAARTAARFGDRLARRGELVARLVPLVEDRNFEVASAAAEALGQLGDETTALPTLLSMSGFKYWKVRAAALRGLLALVERGKAGDLSALARRLPEFPLVSTDFRPEFEIKSTYRRLVETLVARKEGAR